MDCQKPLNVSRPKLTSSGFTLIELLVSLSIIGLLFVFGFSNYRDYARRQAMNATLKALKADLRSAQQKALSGEKNGCSSPLLAYRVEFSETTYSVSSVCADEVKLDQTVTLPSGLVFSPLPSPSVLNFKVLGQGTDISEGQSVTVTLTDSDDFVAQVTIGAGGSVE